MSNAKHTPGPWAITEYIAPGYGHDRHKYRGVVADGLKICETHPSIIHSYDARDLSNASLIAAAPELLEALIQVRAAMPDRTFATVEAKLVIDMVNAAIAKAEGK
ncbi:MAG: hypothetical protein WC455_25915 [Dehalococcoidia bacterium]|jgi:hypothetical protein